MKRKIFTSLAAAGLLACTITTASATQRPTSPRWFCFYWQNPCYDFQLPELEQKPILPETPDTENQAPIVPEIPDMENQTPVIPESPDEEQTPSTPETPEQDNTGTMSQLELEACELVNQMRQQNGLAPLTIDADLSVKARIKSEDMKVNNYFSHTSPTYGSPFTMMQNLGISYRSAGENIAKGYTTAESVVNAWMNSQGHRENILSSSYTSMGIGYVDGYWTQWFIG